MKALPEGEMVVRRINRGRMPHLFWQTQPDKRRFPSGARRDAHRRFSKRQTGGSLLRQHFYYEFILSIV